MTEGDDRFGDLGETPKRSAAERFEERDRTHPEPDEKPRPAPRPSSRYAWLVGVAFFVAIVAASINSLPNEGRSLNGPQPGSKLPLFSAPLARSGSPGDANVCQRRPCAEATGKQPACELRRPDTVTTCQLTSRPLVLTFVFDRGGDCFPQVDRVKRAMGGVRGVNFGVVYFSNKKPDEVARIVRRRGWTMPVARDGDGQIANLYGVGGCPTTVFARKGGRVVRTRLANLSEKQLRADARRLARGEAR